MHHKKDKIQTMKFDDCPLAETEQAWKTGEKYSLRQRQRTQRLTRRNAAFSETITATSGTLQDDNNIEVATSASSSVTEISSSTDTSSSKTIQKSVKSKEKPKSKAAPLSKYRRKTANARERTRMREINSAFENLRKCVPVSFDDGAPSSIGCNEKLTKITTLRMAMKYIEVLNQALNETENSDKIKLLLNGILSKNLENDGNNSGSEIQNSNTLKPSKSKNKSKKNDSLSSVAPNKSSIRKRAATKKEKTPKTEKKSRVNKKLLNYLKSDLNSMNGSSITSSPVLDDSNPVQLGLILESDGESLHLSEPCLSPLSAQHLKPFTCSLLETTKNLNNDSFNNNNILINNDNNNNLQNANNNNSSIDIGLFLESDTDSLQFSEPCLSPLGGFDNFGPFSDLLHSSFAEQSSLDIYLT